MSKIKKLKMVFICIALAYIIYILCSQNHLAGNGNSIGNVMFSQNDLALSDSIRSLNEKKNKEAQLYNSSAFLVNFIDQLKSKYKSPTSNLNYLPHSSESLNQNAMNGELNKIADKKLENFNIIFDNNILPVSMPPEHNGENKSYSNNHIGLSIDDSLYMLNHHPNFESADGNNGYGETIFVTDDIANKLISCNENSGSYKCHTAVSNLNHPQDILVINNSIYIVNAHPEHESGDITRCNINSAGYIDSCTQTPINVINPVFFHYSQPYVYISDFVFSGGSAKPHQAIQCSIDGNGNFINCNEDHNSISMSYISKNYNNAYYRPYSPYPRTSPSSIEKCATLDATFCTRMQNKLLVYPLSLSINHDRIFISNNKQGDALPEILKCSMDMKTCSVVTNEIQSPMCIGVFNFNDRANIN